MRKILFRGQRVDNGEWVEGRLLADDVIVPCGQEFEVEGCTTVWEKLTAYVVIPETVGQYIGLTDKNGKKIFEGDVVKGKVHFSYGYRATKGVIKYYINGFKLMIEKDYKEIPFTCEIIGNIHDNPELLKGGAEK